MAEMSWRFGAKKAGKSDFAPILAHFQIKPLSQLHCRSCLLCCGGFRFGA